MSLSLCQYLTRAVYLGMQAHCKHNNLGPLPLFCSSGPEEGLTLLTLDFASQTSVVWGKKKKKLTQSPFPNVSPIRTRILGHLHRDSFDCHFTPLVGCVWKSLHSSASPWDTGPPPLAVSACWVWLENEDWTMLFLPPNPPRSMHHCIILPPPIIIFPKGLGL